jgi:hypothetical protein
MRANPSKGRRKSSEEIRRKVGFFEKSAACGMAVKSI